MPANARVLQMVGRYNAADTFNSATGGVEAAKISGIGADVSLAGLDVSGRVSAAMLAGLVVLLVGFHYFTRRHQA